MPSAARMPLEAPSADCEPERPRPIFAPLSRVERCLLSSFE